MVLMNHFSQFTLALFLVQNVLFSTSFTPVSISKTSKTNGQHASRAVGANIEEGISAVPGIGNVVEGVEASESINIFDSINNSKVINPSSGKVCTALDGIIASKPDENNGVASMFQNMFNINADGAKNYDNILVIVMPQLGDFDSAEYAELLSAVQDDLESNKIALRIIGLGDTTSAKRFAEFSGLKLDSIRVDSQGSLHHILDLHRGPNWDVPSILPNSFLEWFADYCGAGKLDDGSRDARAITRSWLNYMAMCAGISAPDTLPEILRGYFGDKSAPERLRSDDIVTVPATIQGKDENGNEPFIKIKGITDVKLGPIEYQSLWKNEKGYQRPAELASVRLRFMVEVLSNFGTYVPDQRYLDYRGATYLFGGEQNEQLIYKHIDTGVLSYSETMKRPLSFLEPYIGEKALNPLGLGDPVESV
jgi:hypothetical protein